jgi:hypothetical protein
VLDFGDEATQALPPLRRTTTDPDTKQVRAVQPNSPATTLDDEDDPENTVRIIPGRSRR